MFKKIFIYGISFGSVAGAFMYIHFANGLYILNGGTLFYTLFKSLIIPVTAIIMIVKSMKRDLGTTPVAGTIIITGMFTSLMIGLTVSLIYAILVNTNPAAIDAAISYSVETYERISQEMNPGEPIKIEDYREKLTQQFGAGFQLRANLFEAGSLGLLVSGIIALFFRAPLSSRLPNKKDEKKD
jgi:cell division protein FtsW (lipid II flippase)